SLRGSQHRRAGALCEHRVHGTGAIAAGRGGTDKVCTLVSRPLEAAMRSVMKIVGVTLVVLSAATAFAQMPNPYGMSVTTENAKKAASAALAEARKNNWTMAAAVVDTSGELVYFEKLDGTQAASTLIAQDKARSSVRFKRPTKALQDVLAAGGEGLRLLALNGA